jgi:hypothetical protein
LPHLGLLYLFLLDYECDGGHLPEQSLLVRAHLEVVGVGARYTRGADRDFDEFVTLALAFVSFDGDFVMIIKSTKLRVVNLVEGSVAGPGILTNISKLDLVDSNFIRFNSNRFFWLHAN